MGVVYCFVTTNAFDIRWQSQQIGTGIMSTSCSNNSATCLRRREEIFLFLPKKYSVIKLDLCEEEGGWSEF